ncbi:SOS response-associated peptidase family protein [Pseudoduganella sp. GCM10020061]|uniref:SOS response-associated peptidase family protein n=1 Tax=Pseudoduganella sp. GCM10020061 TaxID=3317345 RepID=UPI00364114CF
MCGRLDQNHTAAEYVAALRWLRGAPHIDSEASPSYNACPGTYRPLMRIAGDTLTVEDLYWGYRAAWAVGRVPVAINARLERISNRYWCPLLRAGRAIVPADGWYEWTGEKGNRQPWHIHRTSGEPMFIAALANFGPFREHRCESGFVLVTVDAQGGMVDVHDRRPIVFSAEDAALWMDPSLDAAQAGQLAHSVALGAGEFAWHPVTREVGKTTSEGAHLAARLDPPPA